MKNCKEIIGKKKYANNCLGNQESGANRMMVCTELITKTSVPLFLNWKPISRIDKCQIRQIMIAGQDHATVPVYRETQLRQILV